MTWVDAVVLLVLGVSAVLAFARGFVREALGLCAWVGAVFLAVRMTPAAVPLAWRLIGNAEVAEPVAFAALFVICLILLSILAGIIARSFRATGLGGLDRTIGLLFGLLRGAALVAVAYMAAGMVFAPPHWPDAVLQARTLPFAYAGARFIAGELPPRFSPSVPPPPAGDTSEGALLQSAPRGFAFGRRHDDQEVQ